MEPTIHEAIVIWNLTLPPQFTNLAAVQAAALHALHHSPFAFPSHDTLWEHWKEFQVCVTVGAPKMMDILANIELLYCIKQLQKILLPLTLMMFFVDLSIL